MSMIETIRDIPVIVEHRKGCSVDFEPMDFENYDSYDSGFPFDNTGRRSRDPLEDIAQRHPELAQHLQEFPRRSRHTVPDQNDDEFLRRRFERPFASGRFERFGFPFNRDDFEREPQRYYEAYPEYFESFQNQQPQSNNSPQGYQQHPPQYSQQYQPQENQQQYKTQQSVSQGTQTDLESPQPQEQEQDKEKEQKSEVGQTTRGRPIQQSNTCDLTQHQPPDEALNEREQRSMSAPPENKRFTSSVNIPMGVHPPDQSGQASSGSTERVIPIHVEGRDDPVIPKHASAQTHQPQPERIFTTDSPRSQPETIFGRRPDAFTQFVHRDPHQRFTNDWPHSFGGFPEDDFLFRSEGPSKFAPTRQEAPHQQQQASRQEPVHQQQQAPKQEAKPPQEQQQPEAPKQPLGPIEQIQAIQKDVSTLLRQVEAFSGLPRDKNYLYLDEMLTRNLLKLDNVDTQGQDAIRSARKEAIKCIERAIGLLEAKAAANAGNKEEKMEVEEQKPQEEQIEEKLEEAKNEQADSNKSEEQQPKTDEKVENIEEETSKKQEEEVKNEEVKKEENEAPKEEAKTEVEEEKKEKKKIKKKVKKEEQEKKQ